MFIKVVLFFSLIFPLTALNANGFTKAATAKPVLVQEGSQKEWCPVCGMNIDAHYKTSHASKINNHKNRQYCSLRCLAVDMQEYEIDLDDIRVVDALTQKLIGAKSAYYVVGSDIRGTMTKVSKLAFSDEEAAEDFSIENGGEIVDFKTALKMAQESLKSDMAMVKNKKEKKIYPMGKKIFQKRCKKEIELKNYLEINELKAHLRDEKLCGELKESKMQPLSLYLWEVKKFGDIKKTGKTISVDKNEKCSVCGMFVYKYPRWTAQIFYGDRHFSFDGVKDMMKYFFMNKEGVSKMVVSDYYSQKAVDAKEAYYVAGSDVYGPMGEELIPFAKESEAKTFYMDHKGSKILRFDEITEMDIKKLDE